VNIRISLNDILVVGYPRSGNTYLARLLGDAFNSPVTGLGSAMPIATEGQERPGPYTVRQLHMKARRGLGQGRALVSAYEFDLDHYAGEYIAHIYRDPRDIAVSAWKFFGHDSLEVTLHNMVGHAPDAQDIHGSWADYVIGWYNASLDNLVQIRYEYLVSHPYLNLSIALATWGLPAANRLDEVIKRQGFSAKRAQIERDGDTRPYGRERQLQALRRGVAGDWRNWFTRREAEIAHAYFYELLEKLGYERDPAWWKSLD